MSLPVVGGEKLRRLGFCDGSRIIGSTRNVFDCYFYVSTGSQGRMIPYSGVILLPRGGTE